MTLAKVINDSKKLIDNFEHELYVSKNYQKIFNSVEQLKIDLEKYNQESLLNLKTNLNDNDKKEIKFLLNNLILKIDKMNSFSKSNANLKDEFYKYRT